MNQFAHISSEHLVQPETAAHHGNNDVFLMLVAGVIVVLAISMLVADYLASRAERTDKKTS